MVKEIWLIPNIASLLHYRGKAKCTQTPIISPLEMNLSREKLSPMNKEVDLAQWRQITEGLELSSKSGMGCPMEGCCCWLWRGSNKRQSKSLTRQTLESIPALSESKKKSLLRSLSTQILWLYTSDRQWGKSTWCDEEWRMSHGNYMYRQGGLRKDNKIVPGWSLLGTKSQSLLQWKEDGLNSWERAWSM